MNPCRTMRVIASFTAAFFLHSAVAAKEIGWVDLIDDAAQTYNDPYLDLSYDQIDALRQVLVARNTLDRNDLSAEARSEAEAELRTTQQSLAAQGIDADWLIAQRWVVAERRERAATAGNPEVDNQTVTLAGFAIAGPPARDGTPVVYLVPERGMCSHMPPPNPNQMIRVRMTGDWRPAFVHEPVRLTGRLSIDPSDEVFHVVDGPVQMNATFLMAAEKVETLADMRAQKDPAARRDWARQLADQLRASGVTTGIPGHVSQ